MYNAKWPLHRAYVPSGVGGLQRILTECRSEGHASTGFELSPPGAKVTAHANSTKFYNRPKLLPLMLKLLTMTTVQKIGY